MIELENVSYSYPTPTEHNVALKNVSAIIKPGITAIIGCTGSGKSTLTEIVAGITEPDKGTVRINGRQISKSGCKIGSVFQYPEYQLFAETVYEDIAYGPKNMGLEGAELKNIVEASARLTGLTDEQLKKQPFELSGGQKRMTAIAGILAMNPDILILDEPAAGLDPAGRACIFDILCKLKNSNENMIIIFVTHSMEDAAQYADDIIVLNNGTIAAHGTPVDIFENESLIQACRLELPEMAKLSDILRKNGIDIGTALTIDAAFQNISSILKGADGYAS